jgi:hypothetical protein
MKTFSRSMGLVLSSALLLGVAGCAEDNEATNVKAKNDSGSSGQPSNYAEYGKRQMEGGMGTASGSAYTTKGKAAPSTPAK